MKIAVLSLWYSEKMGYAENFLPKFLSLEGHEVYLITSTAQIYYNAPFYKSTYEPYLGAAIQPEGTQEIDGFKVIRLPFVQHTFGIELIGLENLLSEIQPDIVQTFEIDRTITYPAARLSRKLNFKLFTESHVHASVFTQQKPSKSIRQKISQYRHYTRYYRYINKRTEICYPISKDCAEIAEKHFCVSPTKIKTQSLGTDTDLFSPLLEDHQHERRKKIREKLGFETNDFVCIYTGRITPDKGPSVLAEAVEILHKEGKKHVKALFIGLGEHKEIFKINSVSGCVVHDFVPVRELPDFYRASDIGVWPLQESTSQIDALACGLPIIINDTTEVNERIDKCGLLFKKNDPHDLADKILQLENQEVRNILSKNAREKAEKLFSWTIIARDRIIDYQSSMKR
jgi:glycosyltransferase involved in cell wall biosynthesis